jgi:hypothetical protein
MDQRLLADSPKIKLSKVPEPPRKVIMCLRVSPITSNSCFSPESLSFWIYLGIKWEINSVPCFKGAL